MSTDTTNPDIPKRKWTNPFPDNSLFGRLYESRVKKNQDLIVVISDYHNRRGTGKTTLSLQLAEMMDRTDEGLTKGKVTLNPEELRNAYASQPKGSGLVLDEAEAGMGNRSSMTNVNKALRKIMSMGRVEEKYLVLNAPNNDHIDKSVKELGDVWILVQKRGDALVHFLEYNPYGSQPLTPKKEYLEWGDMQSGSELRDIHRYLTREKRAKIDGSDGTSFITQSEHRKLVEKEVKEERQALRDEFIVKLYNDPEVDVSQRKLGSIADLHHSTVNSIIHDND